MWSDKSQLPCSQRLWLHELTSSDLGLGTVWTGPYMFYERVLDKKNTYQLWSYHITLFRFITVLCGCVMWDWRYSTYRLWVWEYSTYYCQSHITLLRVWIMLWISCYLLFIVDTFVFKWPECLSKHRSLLAASVTLAFPMLQEVTTFQRLTMSFSATANVQIWI